MSNRILAILFACCVIGIAATISYGLEITNPPSTGGAADLGYTAANENVVISTTSPLAGGGNLSGNRVLSMATATTSVNGYLSAADFTTFNNKQNALGYTPANANVSILTQSPLSGGGDLSTNRTIVIGTSSASSVGVLSSNDWNTFNNKLSSSGGTATLSGVSSPYIAQINGTGTATQLDSVQIVSGTATLSGVSSPYIAQINGTGTGLTFAGNTNLPSGIWNSSGNVGIGTTGPLGKLEIQEDTLSTPTAADGTIVLDGAWSDTTGPCIAFKRDDNDTFIGSKITGVQASNGGFLAFATNSGYTGLVEAMRINKDCNLGVGTTTPTAKLHIWSGEIKNEASGSNDVNNSFKNGNRQWNTFLDGASSKFILRDITGGTNPFLVEAGAASNSLYINSSGNVGIGTTTPNNILTLPVASVTDPIADAWTVHCLADYKDFGTDTQETIRNNATNIVKNINASVFKKKAFVAEAIAEETVKKNYAEKIKKSIERDLTEYTKNTGVEIKNTSYIDEGIDVLWDTETDRVKLIGSKKLELENKKQALPKFQKQYYGIVAEDAPEEAKVRDINGNVQGVDPSVLIGILWANAQRQEERITSLENKITRLEEKQ